MTAVELRYVRMLFSVRNGRVDYILITLVVLIARMST